MKSIESLPKSSNFPHFSLTFLLFLLWSSEALADREWRSAQDRIEVLEMRRNEAALFQMAKETNELNIIKSHNLEQLRVVKMKLRALGSQSL